MNSIDRPVRRVWQSFLNKLFSPSTRPAQKRRWFLPAIESLEKRELLSSSPVWTAIGPAPILQGQTAGSLPVSGRITGIATDPEDANTIFIVAAGGGVWKTTNATAVNLDGTPAVTWQPLTDNLFTDANGNTVDASGHPLTDANGTPIPMFMGAIAETRDSSGHEIVYAGTGEANNTPDNYYGLGILASTDGGATWKLRFDGGAFVGATVAKIVIDPSDTTGQTVYAAIDNNGANAPQTVTVTTGIYKSTNAGATWTNVTQSAGLSTTDTWSDVVIDPINHNLFAAVGTQAGSANNGVYSAPAGGTTWTLVSAIPSGIADGRITLALYDDGTTSEMFVAITNPSTNGLATMLRSTDGEATFQPITANVTSVSDYLLGQKAPGQGNYDTTLTIDPENASYIYAGGDMASQGTNNIFSGSPLESFDGGNSWRNIATDPAGNGPHSDDHAVAFDHSGNLIDGNDGGVFKLSGQFQLSNPTGPANQSWSSLNTNLQITQFTSIAVDPQNSSIVYGGSQDNGTEKSPGQVGWQQIYGGDGGVTRVDPNNSNIVYGEYVNVALQVSINGSAFTRITNNITSNKAGTPPSPIVNFYAPYVLDASGAIYYGTDYLNFAPNPVTTANNVTTVNPSWSSIGTPGVNNFNPNDAAIDAIALAPSNNNVVYVSAGGKIFVTQNAQAGGTNVTWQQIGASFGSTLNSLVVDPNNPGTAYAVINHFSAGSGNHVFMTTNFGAPASGPIWTDISGNFYNSPVNAVALSADGSRIFVGNDVGVYSSGDGGATWARLGTGLPNAQVVDLELVPSQNLIVAGTHGRGAWETSVAWVTNTADSGPGSLRQAILSGASVIDFDIPTTDPVTGLPTQGYNASTGAFTISSSSGYAITSPVVIDGTTQPGFSGQPLIELDGTHAGATDGLEISAGNTTVKGLAIDNFSGNGIALINQGNDVITGDYLGTDPTGTSALGNGLVGLLVKSSNNTIGGTTAGTGNLIAGNGQDGLQIFGSGVTGNVVEGNVIGTNVFGAAALPNGRDGVLIAGGATANTIGGTTTAAANVVSGNTANGVQLNGSGTVSNLVEGNFIGTDSTGAMAVPNQGDGVLLNQGATSNTIGGTSAAAANVISGNMQVGLELDDTGTTYNLVEGNFIGTDHTGATALPNQSDGVFIGLGAGNNTIGGTFAAAGNVISGNSFAGVKLDGSGAGNVVTSNFIGTTAGASALPNQGANIEISASASSPISPANILLIQMGGNTQNITLQVDPNRSSDIDVLQSGAVTPLAQFSLSSFTAIDVVGSGALTLDYSNGSFGMPIDYQGVTPASLAIVGNSSIAFTSTGANSGSFVVNRDTANPVTFTNVTVLPTITLQPRDLLAAKGMTAVFRASATNAEGQPLSVQWQVSADGNNWAAYTPPLNPPPNMPPPVTFYTESTGQTTTTLSFEVDASQVGQEFRAAFSDDGGVHYVNTSPANLIVAPVVTADGTTYNVTYWVGGGREYDDGPLTGDPNSWNYPYNWTDGIPGPNTVAVFDFNVPRYGIANSQGLPTEYFTTPVVYNGTDGTFQPTLYACNVDVVAKVGGIYLATGFAFVDSSGNVTPGTVNVYQPLELTGGSEWDNGNINVSSGANPYLVNDPGAQLTMNNVNVLNLAGGGILSNHGVMIQTGSAAVTHFLQVNGGTVLSNQVGGTFDMEVDGGISADSVSDIFNNYSLVEKTAGTGTSTIGMAFDNLGATVDAESGTLVLGGGGASTGGKYNAAAGAVLDLAGASGVDNDKNPTFSGIFSGTGAGTVGMTLGGSISIGTAGATLDFPLRLNSTTTALFQVSNGSFNFHGNTLTNADTMMLTNAAGTPVLLTSVQSILDEQGGTLVNTGTIVEQGLGGLTTTNNVNLNNQGVYQFTNDGSVTSGGGGGGSFNNLATGLVKKTAGTGTSSLALPFNNQDGTVDAESGTLVLGGGGASTGGTYIANGTNPDLTPVALDLAGTSTPYFTGTYTGSGTGTVGLAQGGSIVVGAGGATLDFPAGLFQVSHGGFNVFGNTLTNAGTMELTNIAGTPITVYGQSGNSETGGTLSNTGLIEEKGLGGLEIDYAITLSNSNAVQFDDNVGVTGAQGTFNNLATGLVKKAAGTGTSSLAIPFNNQGGTVDAESGTLVLSDGGTSTGGTYIANGTNPPDGTHPNGTPAVVDLAGTSTPYFTGTYTGSGSGNIELAQGGQIVVGGATLNFPNLVVSNGGFNLLGNTLTNIGTMTLTNPAGTPVLVVGVNGNSATGGTLSNMGLIEEKGLGGLDIGYAITLSNSKTIQFDNDGGVTGGAGTFNNLATGLVKKAAGTGTSSLAIPFNNQGGTVDAEAGTLVLGDGGASTGGMYIANGTNPDGTPVAVDLAGSSTPYFTGTYTGSGSGNIELAQGGQIIVGGATLDFPNLVVSNGSFNVLNNTLTNAGTLNLANAAGTVVSVFANYPAGTFNNTGTIDEQGAGGLGIGYYVTLNNSGTIQFDNDVGVTGGGGAFNNLATGLVIKAAGTGTSSLAIPFNNQGGTVDAESGTLVLSDGGTSTGGMYIANGTNPDLTKVALDLAGASTPYFTGTYTGSGSGNIELAQGGQIIVGGATLDFPNLVVSNGSFNVLNNTLTNAGTLNLTNAMGTVSVYANYPAGTFNNTGMIDVQGAGGLGINYYVTLNNSGTLQFDGPAAGSVTTPGGGVFNNLATGLVEKVAGAGTSSVALPFNNQGGTVDAESGTLVLSDGGTSTGGTYNANGSGVVDLTGGSSAVFGGTTTGSGTGHVRLASGVLYANAVGDALNFTGPLFQWTGGSLYSLANAGTIMVTGSGGQTFNGDLNNTGALILGPSSNLTVNGNYTQGASATLDAQLGGAPASGQFGQMTVSPAHTANLDGTLQAELVGGFQPGGGDSFTVMSYDTNQGSTFQHFSLPTNLQPQVGAQTVTLTQAIPTSFGNLNLPTIPFGTVNTLISGQLVPNPSSAVVPAGESVQVTLDGVTQDAPLDATDHFATTFDTATLGVTHSPYAISFGYPGDTTFLGASGSSTLTVTPATPTLAWSNPAAIVYGTALSATQLDATANTGGLFTYTLANGATPASGAVLHAGVGQILNVSFAPTDTIDFTSATGQATIAVNPKTLTMSIVDDPTKTYDGSNAATLTSANFLLAGLIGSESFTVTQTAGTYNNKDTDAATVSASPSVSDYSAATGTLASDYTLPTTASGPGTIAAKTLTASIVNDPTKTYDGSNSATLTSVNFLLAGLIGSEGFTVTQTSGTYNSKDTDAATVSAILPASAFNAVIGTSASDYTLPTTASGPGTIMPASQSIAFSLASPVTYGIAPITLTATGGTSGKPVTFALISGPGSLVGSTLTITDIGTIVIEEDQAGSLDYAAARGSSTLTVSPATPTFSNLSVPTITYGTASTTISGTLDANAGQQQIAAGETVQVTLNGVTQSATLNGSDDFTTSFNTSALGVAGSPFTLGFSYDSAANSDANFNNASGSSTLTVSAATLTFTPNAGQSIIYGSTVPTLSYLANGFVNGDSISLLTGLLGTTTSATSSVGAYLFTLGTLSAGANYTLHLSANPPTFAVTPATLTITPNPGQSMIYGSPVPTLSYLESGFVNGDTASLLAGLLGTTATATSPVGAYPFTLGTLGAGGNYALTLSGNTPTLAVTPAGTATTAQDVSAPFSTANQSVTLSASVTPTSGLDTVNEGTVTFTLFNSAGTTQTGSSVTSSTVANGSASATFVLPGNTALGTYQVHAFYNQGPDFTVSSDDTKIVTVNPATTVKSVTVGAQSRSATYKTGISVSYAIVVATSTHGPNPPNVNLTVSGLPSGVVGAFSRSSLPSGGGTVTLTLTTSSSTAAGAFSFTVTATASNSLNHNGTLTIIKAVQTITFAALPAKTYGAADFALSGTSSSALPVTYTASGNVTVSLIAGVWTAHITGAGSATITAHQAGDSNHNAAGNVARILTIHKAAQSIIFAALTAKIYGAADFALSATSSSGLAVTYTASGAATVFLIAGVWTVHITGAGSATITAHQAGGSNYNAAANVAQTFTIAKATPAFSNLSSPLIAHGTNTSATISGQVAAGTTVATGSVVITITGNGVNLTKTVAINTHGSFSTVFTHNWAAGAYTVSYRYAGTTNFNAITPNASTILNVS